MIRWIRLPVLSMQKKRAYVHKINPVGDIIEIKIKCNVCIVRWSIKYCYCIIPEMNNLIYKQNKTGR